MSFSDSRNFFIENILKGNKTKSEQEKVITKNTAMISSTMEHLDRRSHPSNYFVFKKIKEELDDAFIFNKQTMIHFPRNPSPGNCQCQDCSYPYQRFNCSTSRLPPPLLIPIIDLAKENDEEQNESDIEVDVVDEMVKSEISVDDDIYSTSETSSISCAHEERSMSVHDSNGDSVSSQKYVCNVCDRSFTWFGNFQKHVLTHGEPKNNDPLFPDDKITEEGCVVRDANNTFRCKLCNKGFTRLSGLRTHIRMHNGLRPFKCTACTLAFTTKRALKMHTRIHSGERPYRCTQCDKTFTRKDELQAHTYLHKGEKPYKCEVCSSAFVRQGHLQRHMLTHAKEKPYKCKLCPKSFTQYRNLQTHTYKHTGERPYKCRFCDKGFTQHGTVQAHERTHTGNKPYACDQCDKRFITSSHLRWHLKKHHDNKHTTDKTTADSK